eukprot:5904528-Amphidinium_carterae.1
MQRRFDISVGLEYKSRSACPTQDLRCGCHPTTAGTHDCHSLCLEDGMPSEEGNAQIKQCTVQARMITLLCISVKLKYRIVLRQPTHATKLHPI